MQETRQNKIARLLQKELAEIFQGQTRQTHGILVSVTRVRVSPDLSICTAYLSIFPPERRKTFSTTSARTRRPYATTLESVCTTSCASYLSYGSSRTTASTISSILTAC